MFEYETKTKEEKEIFNIINGYIKNKSFIDVKDFVKYANCLVIISYKSTGKSYSAYKYILNDYKTNKSEFAIVRNTAIEVQLSRVEDSILTVMNDVDIPTNEYKIRDGTIYKVDPKLNYDRGTPIGMIATMNKAYNTASQNTLNNCRNILYDEFINPNFNKKDLFVDFMKMCSTLMRKNKAHIFLLGNKHEANNDILIELGVEFDWENTENQIIYRPEQNLLALYLGRWEIKETNAANDFIESLSMYSPSMSKFTKGNISNNNMYGVKSWTYNKLYELFTPIFKFDLNNTRYCLGTIKDDGNIVYYIKQMDSVNEFDTCNKVYCYLSKDKLPDNVYIADIDDLDSVELMLSQYSAGNLYFSTSFGKSEFKSILIFLKALIKK